VVLFAITAFGSFIGSRALSRTDSMPQDRRSRRIVDAAPCCPEWSGRVRQSGGEPATRADHGGGDRGCGRRFGA